MYGRQEVSKKRQLETTQETSPPGDSASSPGKGGGAPEELRGPSWAGVLPLAQSGSLHSEVFLLGEGVPSGAQWSSVPGGPSPGNIRALHVWWPPGLSGRTTVFVLFRVFIFGVAIVAETHGASPC